MPEQSSGTVQLELGQTYKECPRPFSDLGVERCEHVSKRGNRCEHIGEWDWKRGKILCPHCREETPC